MRRLLAILLAVLVSAVAMAPGAEAKVRKLIAARQFQIPENIPGPQPSTGSATITGKLGIRACFTSAWSDGRKVKCPGRVVRACTEGRAVRVRAHGYPAQFVTTGPGGSIAATVPYPVEGGYEEVALSVPTETRRAKRLKISCFGTDVVVAIDSPEVG